MTNEADVCLSKILHSQERFAVNVEQRVSKKRMDRLRGSIPGELLLRYWSGAATRTGHQRKVPCGWCLPCWSY